MPYQMIDGRMVMCMPPMSAAEAERFLAEYRAIEAKNPPQPIIVNNDLEDAVQTLRRLLPTDREIERESEPGEGWNDIWTVAGVQFRDKAVAEAFLALLRA